MHDPSKVRIRHLAAKQSGILSRLDLESSGFDAGRRKWIVGTGELDRLYPGVYRIAGVPWSWEARLLAYCWAQHPHGYASHRSAARLWGVSGFDDRCIDVLVYRHTRHPRMGRQFLLHESRRILPRDLTVHRGIPVTAPARTVVDLAAVASEERVEFLVESLQRLGRCTITDIEEAVDRLSGQGRARTKKLRSVLGRQGTRGRHVDSETNLRLRTILVGAGINEPLLEYELELPYRTVFPDLCYPNLKIVLECVSDTYHLRTTKYGYDSKRRNDMLTAGWLVVEFTWHQVYEEPEATTAAVRAAIRSRRQTPRNPAA